MDKQEKIDFVRSILDSMKEEVCLKINSDEIPERWDGRELRHYIIHLANKQLLPMNKSNQREFNNDILIYNL